eukprot:6416926-Amphidinium_carterae.1
MSPAGTVRPAVLFDDVARASNGLELRLWLQPISLHEQSLFGLENVHKASYANTANSSKLDAACHVRCPDPTLQTKHKTLWSERRLRSHFGSSAIPGGCLRTARIMP